MEQDLSARSYRTQPSRPAHRHEGESRQTKPGGPHSTKNELAIDARKTHTEERCRGVGSPLKRTPYQIALLARNEKPQRSVLSPSFPPPPVAAPHSRGPGQPTHHPLAVFPSPPEKSGDHPPSESHSRDTVDTVSKAARDRFDSSPYDGCDLDALDLLHPKNKTQYGHYYECS